MGSGSEEQPYLNAGQYIGYRLLQLGCDTVFNVPGDFNLPILDALATVPGMRLINTTNELNSAYAADGYARATGGLGCNVTTFLVGALSAINGVAGAYAEELPVLSIVWRALPPIPFKRMCCSSSMVIGHWSLVALNY